MILTANGERVGSVDTAEKLGLEDEDLLDVTAEQELIPSFTNSYGVKSQSSCHRCVTDS